MKLLTAIPVYNEEQHLESAAARGETLFAAHPRRQRWLDGSHAICLAKDSELSVVTQRAEPRYGAASLRHLSSRCRRSCDVLGDDGLRRPTRRRAFPVLLEAIHDADIVSGSRYLREFRQNQGPTPADRRYINETITLS